MMKIYKFVKGAAAFLAGLGVTVHYSDPVAGGAAGSATVGAIHLVVHLVEEYVKKNTAKI